MTARVLVLGGAHSSQNTLSHTTAIPLNPLCYSLGTGFIGRHLVVHLVENNLAAFIRVVDKVLPQTAYLNPRQQAAFAKVQFQQGNLARQPTVVKAFTHEDGAQFDVVINCAAVTKYGQDDLVYRENVYDLSIANATEAAKRGVKFIELSTAQIYESDKSASDETDKPKPWTSIAEHKLRVEEELAKIPGLKYIIVRPAIVYGPGDLLGITPRLIVGAVYKKSGETMKLLWTNKLRLNTVHVEDVAAALWHVSTSGALGQAYNLADKSDSTQGSITEIVANLFGIKHDYAGTMMSQFAKLNMKSVTEEVNEGHMEPWMEMCTADGIESTPLSPYLDQELLYNNSLSVDGKKIETTGFVYKHPILTEQALRAVVQEFIELRLFPKGFLV
eukprot:m.271446 g.271446  ORF g.271446 m.271446 type:complete len:388 (-) comp54778_c0_seq2:191-1354(-)